MNGAPPILSVGVVAVSLESTHSLCRVNRTFFHALYIHSTIRTNHEVPPRRSIYALQLCTSQLQWPSIAQIFDYVQPGWLGFPHFFRQKPTILFLIL